MNKIFFLDLIESFLSVHVFDVTSPMSEVNSDALSTGTQVPVLDHVPQPSESNHAVVERDSEQRLQRVQQPLETNGKGYIMGTFPSL